MLSELLRRMSSMLRNDWIDWVVRMNLASQADGLSSMLWLSCAYECGFSGRRHEFNAEKWLFWLSFAYECSLSGGRHEFNDGDIRLRCLNCAYECSLSGRRHGFNDGDIRLIWLTSACDCYFSVRWRMNSTLNAQTELWFVRTNVTFRQTAWVQCLETTALSELCVWM